MSHTLDQQTWIRRFHPAAGRDRTADEPRLLCFPHAGGSATAYFRLSEELSPRTDVFAVQYPGRQDRLAEPRVEKLTELADLITEVITGWDDRPLALFGHSMGSVLAYEVAQRYERGTGRPVTRLFASGYPAPSQLRGGTIHERDTAGVVAELRLVGGTAPEWLADEDLLAMVLPAVRSDYRAIETHPRDVGSRITGPISMLVGDDDPHTTVVEAQAWEAHTAGSFDLTVFPGGHFYLEEHNARVAALISAALHPEARPADH